MPQPKFQIGSSLKSMRTAFDENRQLIVRMTVAFAALNAASALLDIAGPAGLAVSVGITILLGAAYGGMVTALICLPGKSEGAAELWATVKPVLARLIWVTLITALAVLLGVPPLIKKKMVIATLLAVAGQTVVVERRGVFESLGRSFELVQNQAWRVFGYLVVVGLLSVLMLGIALQISAPLGTGVVGRLVGNFLSNSLSTPVVAIGTAVLYTKLAELKREYTEAAGPDPQP